MNRGSRAILFCAIVIIAGGAFGADDPTDPRPLKQDAIQAAIDRGNQLRMQEEIVPGALQTCAIIMKRNGVRCGHVYMSILGARGEGGGTYRFTLQMKAALVRGDQALVVQNNGTFLLASDLSLINGEMLSQSEWQARGAGGAPLTQQQVKFSTENDTLVCEMSEQGPEEHEFKKKGEQRLPLKTFRPVPSEVLVCLASFAAKKEQLTLNDGKAACVPTISLSETRSFSIKPAWIGFHAPTNPPHGMSLLSKDEITSIVRIRYLTGGIIDTGLQVQPPTPEEWASTANYGLDVRQRVVALPASQEATVTLESVEPKDLNPKEPFNFDAIIKASGAKPETKAEPAPAPEPKR